MSSEFRENIFTDIITKVLHLEERDEWHRGMTIQLTQWVPSENSVRKINSTDSYYLELEYNLFFFIFAYSSGSDIKDNIKEANMELRTELNIYWLDIVIENNNWSIILWKNCI